MNANVSKQLVFHRLDQAKAELNDAKATEAQIQTAEELIALAEVYIDSKFHEEKDGI